MLAGRMFRNIVIVKSESERMRSGEPGGPSRAGINSFLAAIAANQNRRRIWAHPPAPLISPLPPSSAPCPPHQPPAPLIRLLPPSSAPCPPHQPPAPLISPLPPSSAPCPPHQPPAPLISPLPPSSASCPPHQPPAPLISTTTATTAPNPARAAAASDRRNTQPASFSALSHLHI
ncbi:pollen-specific leucine-rich repeat extensin-like protein 2 [Penaeus chinensis]|uniref:pollen-specific leucine-rich repeat extensin-like protein 2 n=1 Tax=Penaeus chinensis TaxID=139456 RepID=UPI001FB67C25|nr:pollen-specific leucine-rich repeat extensin-like protein 2 [Penaeus chinensis]